MEKKRYMVPLIEVMNLSAGLMQDTPLFGPASYAAHPFDAPEREKAF